MSFTGETLAQMWPNMDATKFAACSCQNAGLNGTSWSNPQKNETFRERKSPFFMTSAWKNKSTNGIKAQNGKTAQIPLKTQHDRKSMNIKMATPPGSNTHPLPDDYQLIKFINPFSSLWQTHQQLPIPNAHRWQSTDLDLQMPRHPDISLCVRSGPQVCGCIHTDNYHNI